MTRARAVALGEAVQINPKLPPSQRPAAELPVTFVPMANVCEREGAIVSPDIRRFGEVSKGYTTFTEKDVLFAKITPCMENGKAAIARDLLNGIGAGSTEFYVLRAGNAVLPEFVFHFIRRPQFRQLCKANFTGSAGQQRVPKSFLERVPIPLPPLEEQRRIVGLLDRAAEIRRRAGAARARARAVIPALFLDMFGDAAAGRRSWSVQPLKTVAQIGSGLTKGRKLRGETTLVPYLRVANVQDGHLDLSEVKTIEATTSDIEKCSLQAGDLLITEGGDADKLGRCAIWQDEVPGCLHQNHVFRVRVGRALLPEYAASFIQSPAGKSYFLRVAKRTTGIASINKTQLGALPVVVPPLELQRTFVDLARQVNGTLDKLDAAARKAEAMAAALSAEVFG